jgi:ADP-heptose:LPS heptosyltransferase
MKPKSKIFLFVSGIFSIILYSVLKIFFKRGKSAGSSSVAFFTSGKIGDLVMSSIILENENLFKDKKIYFLYDKKFSGLFKNYCGNSVLVPLDLKKYKFSLFERIRVLKYLYKQNFSEFYNISPARGIINDEISLLSSAEKKYTTCSHIYFYPVFIKRILDSDYDDILFQEEVNEYKKVFNLIKKFSCEEIFFGNKFVFKTGSEKKFSELNDFILISPMVTYQKRGWDLYKFRRLIMHLREKKNNVALIGAGYEKEKLVKLTNGDNTIKVITPEISETHYIISKCKMFIGNDSGLTHIALKLSRPLLAIIDGGFFNMYFPFFEDNPNVNFVYNKLDCFQCFWNCIYPEPRCITEIKYETVEKKVTKILNDLKR